jgi:putative endonuclease
MKRWCVYMLRCSDGSLYAGSTNDLEKRVETHNTGKAARYTRSRRPVKLVWWQPAVDRSHAQRLEAEIKLMTRRNKLELIKKEPDVYAS